MKHILRFAVALALMTSTAAVAGAQNALRMAAACAPRAVTAPPADRCPASHRRPGFRGDASCSAPATSSSSAEAGRGAWSSASSISCDGRPRAAAAPAPARSRTAGWIRVVAVDDTTAIALVDFACDGLLRRRSPRAVRGARPPARCQSHRHAGRARLLGARAAPVRRQRANRGCHWRLHGD